jgi:hypothetical protein
MKNKFRILKRVLIEKVTLRGHVWDESRNLVPFASRRSQKSLARCIQRRSSMTTIKLLSAGLIAIATLATPVMARENYVAQRHAAEEANTRAHPTARYIYGHVGIPAQRVGALPAPPDGENCDVGDNARIC